jgi:hypothetical protein
MRQFLLLFLFSVLCSGPFWSARAQTLAFTQAQLTGTPANTGGSSADAMVVDNLGNRYTSGTFSGTMSVGGTTLTTNGDIDLFITKQDVAGTYLWVKQLVGSSSEANTHLVLDAANNLYIAGQTQSPTLILGTLTLSLAQADVFVAKLDGAGNFLWATGAGHTAAAITPTNNPTQLLGMTLDASGTCYVTGYFMSTVAFGSTSLTSAGSADVFAAKITSAGTWIWAIRIGGPNSDVGWGVAVDAANNLYLTGYFAAYLGFGPGVSFGSTTLYSGNSSSNIFVTKLSATGTFIWAVQAGGSDAGDEGHDLVLDNQGNAYITGVFSRTANFGSFTLTSAGNYDAFVAKLTPSGTFAWATRGGGTAYDYGDVLSWKDGELYMASRYQGTATFGPATFLSAGQSDVVLSQLSATGTILSAVGAGSVGNDQIYGLLAAGQQQVYAGGYFQGPTITFGTTTLTAGAVGSTGFITRALGSAALATRVGSTAQLPLTAWPNPTTSFVHLTQVDATQAVEIYNAQGRQVASFRPAATLALQLPRGVYVMRNGSQTTRLVVE